MRNAVFDGEWSGEWLAVRDRPRSGKRELLAISAAAVAYRTSGVSDGRDHAAASPTGLDGASRAGR